MVAAAKIDLKQQEIKKKTGGDILQLFTGVTSITSW